MTVKIQNRSIAILTQFNLEPPSHWKVPNRSLEKTWLEERLDLMDRTSLPSLRGQTVKEFIWVIFIHPLSPSWLRARLEGTAVDSFERRLVEVDGFEDVQYGKILESVIPNENWLTIKLDSDDLLARNFVEVANRCVEKGVYCSEDGAYLNVKSMRAFKRHYPNNPFPYQISARGRSVLDQGHHLIQVDYPVRSKYPMWMQFHHGGNVSPDWHPIRMLARPTVQSCFEFPESVRVHNPKLTRIGRVVVSAQLIIKRNFAALKFQSARVQRKLSRRKRSSLK